MNNTYISAGQWPPPPSESSCLLPQMIKEILIKSFLHDFFLLSLSFHSNSRCHSLNDGEWPPQPSELCCLLLVHYDRKCQDYVYTK